VDIVDGILTKLIDLVYDLMVDDDFMNAKLLRNKWLSKHAHRRKVHADQLFNKSLTNAQVTTKVMSIYDFSSEKIAEQMSLLDLALFQKIETPEVLQWSKEQTEELSPHLTQFTEHFNNVSFWTRSIILSESRPLYREKLLNKFIRVLRHLRKYNNFNSYLAVLSALDSAPVQRLEWQRTTSEGLQEYCKLIDSTCSFKAYRNELSKATVPCIPYIGLVLQDLTFIHIANKDEVAPGVVNFRKRWQQFNILENIRRFKLSTYPFDPDQEVIEFFDGFRNYLPEEAMWELSLEYKPKNRRATAPVAAIPAAATDEEVSVGKSSSGSAADCDPATDES